MGPLADTAKRSSTWPFCLITWEVNMSLELLATVRTGKATLVLLAVISLMLSASRAEAGTVITQSVCPVVIAQPGEYSLGTDVGPCLPNVDGIVITASNVTLQLKGHNIIGSLSPTACNTSVGIR